MSAANGELDHDGYDSEDEARFFDNNDLANRIWEDNELFWYWLSPIANELWYKLGSKKHHPPNFVYYTFRREQIVVYLL